MRRVGTRSAASRTIRRKRRRSNTRAALVSRLSSSLVTCDSLVLRDHENSTTGTPAVRSSSNIRVTLSSTCEKMSLSLIASVVASSRASR
jgi:hypothetical protein